MPYSLTVAPEFAVEIEEGFDIAASPFGSAIIQRGEYAARNRRRWRLAWRTLTRTDKDALVALVRNTRGGTVRFSWTPTDEAEAVDVRAFGSSFRWQQESGVAYSATLEVEEV